jgi:hypothetical protein
VCESGNVGGVELLEAVAEEFRLASGAGAQELEQALRAKDWRLRNSLIATNADPGWLSPGSGVRALTARRCGPPGGAAGSVDVGLAT